MSAGQQTGHADRYSLVCGQLGASIVRSDPDGRRRTVVTHATAAEFTRFTDAIANGADEVGAVRIMEGRPATARVALDTLTLFEAKVLARAAGMYHEARDLGASGTEWAAWKRAMDKLDAAISHAEAQR